MIELISPDEKIEYRIDDSIFYLRRMPAEIHAAIVASHTRRVKDQSIPPSKGDQGGCLWRTETDTTRVLLDCIEYIVVAWDNIIDPESKDEVPCNAINKRQLPMRVMEELIEAVSGAGKATEEEAEMEIENLYKYLATKKDYPALDCDACGPIDGEDEPPECMSCPMVPLHPTNRDAMKLYDLLNNSFISRQPLGDILALFVPGITRDRARVLVLKLALIDTARKDIEWQSNLSFQSMIRAALQ